MASLVDAVGRASSEALVAAGARLTKGAAIYPFLAPGSSLIGEDVDSFVDGRLATGPTPHDVEEFAEFLVLATSFHLLEGWRYLSKSAYALLNASRTSALHLAYYAELRAARSILAGAGICIRDTWHFAITSSGTVVTCGAPRSGPTPPTRPSSRAAAWASFRTYVRRLIGFRASESTAQPDGPISTHAAASDALKAWSRIEDNGKKVVDASPALAMGGVNWAEACRATASRAQLAANWLTDWSMDLGGLVADSYLRNRASYGVDVAETAFDALTRDELDYVVNVNRSSLYEGDGSLDGVDLALLHDFCMKSGRLLYDRNQQQIWTKLKQWLSTSGGMGLLPAKALVKRVQEADRTAGGLILKRARRSNRNVDGVFSRAYLLLRLATTMQRSLWNYIRITSPRGEAGWQSTLLAQFARYSHLTSLSEVPTSYTDFQEDQQAAIDDTAGWLAANPFSSYELWRNLGESLREVARLERIALWSCVT
jgi:hypothetical protein